MGLPPERGGLDLHPRRLPPADARGRQGGGAPEGLGGAEAGEDRRQGGEGEGEGQEGEGEGGRGESRYFYPEMEVCCNGRRSFVFFYSIFPSKTKNLPFYLYTLGFFLSASVVKTNPHQQFPTLLYTDSACVGYPQLRPRRERHHHLLGHRKGRLQAGQGGAKGGGEEKVSQRQAVEKKSLYIRR